MSEEIKTSNVDLIFIVSNGCAIENTCISTVSAVLDEFANKSKVR